MEKVRLQAKDGYLLDVHVFNVENPKAVVQIVHGMEEHQERYEDLARFLNDNGFTVVSSDMRGHGVSAPVLGFFKKKNGYKELVNDQNIITKWVKERYSDVPVYIFAHSMGTIIVRNLLQTSSGEYEKVVLSGYPNYQSGAYIGIVVAKVTKFFRGAKHKSKFIQKLGVDQFNKGIKNPKTPVDWVCHNEETVQSYMNDPYCGIGFTCSAFDDLFHLVKYMHRPKRYKNVNSDLNLLMLRGEDDPCTGGEKGSADSINILKKAGFKDISRVDYKDMRHEIINEKEKQKVYNDVLDFYNKD